MSAPLFTGSVIPTIDTGLTIADVMADLDPDWWAVTVRDLTAAGLQAP